MSDKKCLYKKQMESADSTARIDKTNRNSVSIIGIEKVIK